MRGFGNILAVTVILLLLLIWGKTNGIIVLSYQNHIDFVALLLVAATLVVTGVGVAAALVTLYGFKEVRRAAIRAAKEEAARVAAAVAEPVAARTVEPLTSSTSPEDAAKLVSSLEPPGSER